MRRTWLNPGKEYEPKTKSQPNKHIMERSFCDSSNSMMHWVHLSHGASCEGSFFHCTTAPAPFPSKHLRLCGHPDFFQLLRWPVQRSCEELKIEIKSIKIDRFRCSYLFLGTTFTVASQDAPAAREMGSHSTLSTSKNWSSTNFYQFLLRSVSLFSSAT